MSHSFGALCQAAAAAEANSAPEREASSVIVNWSRKTATVETIERHQVATNTPKACGCTSTVVDFNFSVHLDESPIPSILLSCDR